MGCQLWLAKDSPIYASVTDLCRVHSKQEHLGIVQNILAWHLPPTLGVSSTLQAASFK